MLTHYSALKVAENFRLLQSLYPGRIDLGIGRAPGSDSLTAAALAYPGMARDVRHFPQQVADVMAYLSDSLDRSHPFSGVHAGPGQPAGTPDIWLLGSYVESAHMAAKMGLPFSYAHFFGNGAENGPLIVESYRRHFQPSASLAEPLVNVGVHVLCAETEEEASRLATSRNLMKLRSALGVRSGVPSVEEAVAYPYRPEESAYLEQIKRSYVDGNPQQVKDKLEDLADLYQTTDLTIVTICHGFAERVRSYELLAEVCELKSGQ
jgi:luciferase family oxidoreductase group 1